MTELAAFSTLGVTVGLVLARPRIGPRLRVGPASAAAVGVLLMLAEGFVRPSDMIEAARVLWRPFLTITAIMVTTAAAHRLGVLNRLAAATYSLARGSVPRLFMLVFFLSAATAAALNNDAAVLLLTPLVVVLVRGLYPSRPSLVVPFAFAVFMAAGVAPLVVSNPMNMIVAAYAGLDFNEYALRMLPISATGWVVAFLVLRWVFRRDLAEASKGEAVPLPEGGWTTPQVQALALLVCVLGAYPVVTYLGGPIWLVAASGAAVALWLCRRHTAASPADVVLRGVSWETLVFLLGAFVLAVGLRNAGVVERLASVYHGAHVALIGTVSAVGSALVNNHPMALMNMLAIEVTPRGGRHEILAALIGGDLGPRLLPIGSLAGLLWFATLRRLHVEVPVWRFARVGALVTIPSLAVSLFLLDVL